MGYEQENYRRIREEYQTKYLVAREAADRRRAEVAVAIPAVALIDAELQKTGLAIMKAALDNDYENRIAELRDKNQSLQATRRHLLVESGYPADYTDVKYECPVCQDTGYVDCKMCDCMKRKLILAGYESSGMADLLNSQSFENFSLDYYAASPSVHQHMTKVYGIMKQYADTFAPGKSGNLVLFGGTGLGKTHLSSAVARTVIESGCDVFYASAVGCLADFEYQRFGNASGSVSGTQIDRYFNCDLLILDDLGTEVGNQFTTSVLYNLINTRLNRRVSTIISTNLTQEEFRKRYWDRITSRVLGEYTVLPFAGTDIRLLKKV